MPILQELTGVILAGGKGRRMGGQDKGLLRLNGKPMIEHIIAVLQPQIGRLLISANRNLETYRKFGFQVVPDKLEGFFGPLAGMASAMQTAESKYLLTVPCDSPLLPENLAETLFRALQREAADLSVVHNGTRMQQVFALLRCELLPNLLTYLEKGGRKIEDWYALHRVALADFEAQSDSFLNINTPEDRRFLEQKIDLKKP